jgi:hypothetical protein
MEEKFELRFNPLIQKYKELHFFNEENPTFLEILAKRDAETLWSRILAFYLNPSKEHNLKDLLLKSLLQTISNYQFKAYNLKSVEVKIEYQNIDLVIITDTFILGIENKVNFWLHNDLNSYYTSLKDLGKFYGIKKEDIKLIVLSKYEEDITDEFSNVLYADLLKKIKELFFSYSKNANSKYLMLLLDFIENIEKSLNMPTIVNKDNLENFEFIANNYRAISELNSLKNQYLNEMGEMLMRITQKLNFHIKSLDTQYRLSEFTIYDCEIDYPDETLWYISSEITIENSNLLTIKFSLNKNNPNDLWHFYFEKDRVEYANENIPNFKDLKSSIDEEKVVKFLIGLIDIALKILNT